MVEASLVLPVLLLIVFGGIDTLRLLYNKHVIHSALIEGLQLAKNEPELFVDVWDIEARQDFERYRDVRREILSKTEQMLQKRLFGHVKLHSVTHLDRSSAGGVMTPLPELPDSGLSKLAFLPPRYSAVVNEWSTPQYDGHGCTARSEETGMTKYCDVTGTDMKSLLREYPTKLMAFAEIPTVLFGKKKVTVTAEAYVMELQNRGPRTRMVTWDSEECGGRDDLTESQCPLGLAREWDACFLSAHVIQHTDGTAKLNCEVTRSAAAPSYVIDSTKTSRSRTGETVYRQYRLSEKQVVQEKAEPPIAGTEYVLTPASQVLWDANHAAGKTPNPRTKYYWYAKFKNAGTTEAQWVLTVKLGNSDQGYCKARCIRLDNDDSN